MQIRTKLRHRVSASLALAAAVMVAPTPFAIAQAAGSDAQASYWYDGALRRPLQLSSDGGHLVPPGAAIAASARARKVAGAVAQRSKVSISTLQAAGAPSAEPVGAVGNIDATTSDSVSVEQALPGGVLVGLKQPMDEASARALLQSQGLTPVREIGTGSGTWLVESPAGLASVSQANQLFESGVFASAQPNWRASAVRK